MTKRSDRSTTTTGLAKARPRRRLSKSAAKAGRKLRSTHDTVWDSHPTKGESLLSEKYLQAAEQALYDSGKGRTFLNSWIDSLPLSVKARNSLMSREVSRHKRDIAMQIRRGNAKVIAAATEFLHPSKASQPESINRGAGTSKGDPSSTDGDGPAKKTRKQQPRRERKRAPKPKRSRRTASLANTSTSRGEGPRVESGPKGQTITLKREQYVGEIKSTGPEFQTKSFLLTPANESLFPFASNFARRYESYRFNYLKFEYKNSASAATNGMVGLGAEFDSKDPDPSTKKEFLDMVPRVRTDIWNDCSMSLSAKQLQKIGPQHFIGPVGPQEVLMLDFNESDTRYSGRAFLMMEGVPEDVLGEVWVSYSVTFYTPDYAPPPIPEPWVYTGTNTGLPGTPFGDEASVANPANSLNPKLGISLGIDLATGKSALTFLVPGKYYSMDWRCTFASGALNSLAPLLLTTTVGDVTHFSWPIYTNEGTGAVATAARAHVQFGVRGVSPGVGAVITMTAPAFGGGQTLHSSFTLYEISEATYTHQVTLALERGECKERGRILPGSASYPAPSPSPSTYSEDDHDLPAGYVLARASRAMGFA